MPNNDSRADQVLSEAIAVLLAVRGPYCWCRFKYPDGQGKIHHTNACIAAQKLTGVEYGEER